MWVLDKIKSSMENIPLELNHYKGRTAEDTCARDKLHNNVITPDRIPEFSLPPRLYKRSTLIGEGEMLAQTCSANHSGGTMQLKSKEQHVIGVKTVKKPLPFCAEAYGLAGISESPNTRRKESLFHIRSPTYIFDRDTSEINQCKTTSGFSLLSNSSHFSPSAPPLKGAVSCPSLIEGKGRWQSRDTSLTTSISSPPSLQDSFTLAPPLAFPLDVLQCQERLQKEHVLPLQGRGKVCLSAEHFASLSLCTIRIRVVSVEGLRDDSSPPSLNCAVSVSLTPGKLQQQQSATVKNCRRLIFNEDFFFTELSQEDLQQLKLRLKVMDKSTAGALRRATVIGVVSKPLCQLLPLRNEPHEKT
ncbi:C2 calcium-dependent domain-containing protein 4C [Synchiropus splendidus]|uniref:C2 calcium-dependent domain-containing protein 4C n=1 Tax=Synchiropus splendidus TaxID=270530 RepID=UPI00237D37C6|nr:C2 calcium-dependent domain-containing protein 4C [Synchiropus splendidus]